MGDSASHATDLIDLYTAAGAEIAPADQGLAIVEREAGFGDRYRVWRGRSGRRYLVTVMPFVDAARVENGIVLVVAIAPDGDRQVIWAGEAGAGLPGLQILPGHRIEAHVHLIAADPDRRRAAIDDLVSATQSYSSVLTTSAAASHASVGSTTPRRSSSRAVLRT